MKHPREWSDNEIQEYMEAINDGLYTLSVIDRMTRKEKEELIADLEYNSGQNSIPNY